MDTCNYTFVKTLRIYNTNREPLVTLCGNDVISVGLSVITNVPPLVQRSTVGEVMHV